MSLEYLKAEENEEYISLRERCIAHATMRALEDLAKKVEYFNRNIVYKSSGIRYIDNMHIKHSELIPEEIEAFTKSVETWVNDDVKICYSTIHKLISEKYEPNKLIMKKKVVLTPDEEVKYEQYLKVYIKEETK